MFRGNLQHTGYSDGYGSITNKTLTLKWSYKTGTGVWSSPAIADLDNDGELEVVVGSDDYKIYCLSSNGEVEWSYKTDLYVKSSPAIADLDNDGELEVVVSSMDGKAYCLSSKGEVKWSHKIGEAYVRSSPAIADLDNDGELEVVITSDEREVYCLSPSGKVEWSYYTGGYMWPSPAIADLDKDGELEVVAGSDGGGIYCLSSNGELEWKLYLGGMVTSSPAIADLDKDGELEVVVGSWDKAIYCLNSNGKIVWKYTTGDRVLLSSAAIADLDNDGELEVVVGSSDQRVYCLSSSGSLEWSYKTDDMVFSSPAIADLDNDGELEVVVGSHDCKVYCLSSSGSLEWSYKTDGRIVSSPAIADLDNDGELEVVVSSDGGSIYCFDTSSLYLPTFLPFFLLVPVGGGLIILIVRRKRPKVSWRSKPLPPRPKAKLEFKQVKPSIKPRREKPSAPPILLTSKSLWSRLKDSFDSKPTLRKSLVLGAELLLTLVAGPLSSYLVEVASKAVEIARRYPSIVDHLGREDVKEAIESFIRSSIEDRQLREEVREAVKEVLKEDPSLAPEIGCALSQIRYDLSSLLSSESETMSFLSKVGNEVDSVLSTLSGIEQLISYYYIPSSKEEVLSPWGLPSHLDDALTMSGRLALIVEKACSILKNGENVILIGEPGTGKTTLLYAIWKGLWDQGLNLALLREGAPVGRHHEDKGFYLFFDDLPEAPELADMVSRVGARGVVATARTSEWSRLKPKTRESFITLEVPRMSKDEVRKVLINHLERLSIPYSKEAVEEVVSRAEGLPVYAWTVVRDLQVRKRSLTLDAAKKMPRAMLDYVEQVIASTLLYDGRALPGAYCCLASLYCLSAMRGRRAHADHLHEIHRFASSLMREEVGDRPDPGLFASIRTYLVRDAELMAYKLPHDSWADILEGKGSGPVSVYIDDIRNILTEEERKGLLKSSFLRAWDRALSDYQRDPLGNADRALSLAYLGLINFKIQLKGLEEIVEEFKDRRISLVLRNLMMSL